MRFDCGLSPATKSKLTVEAQKAAAEDLVLKLWKWAPVFAWWPTRIDEHLCVWLETYQERYPAAHVLWSGYEEKWIVIRKQRQVREVNR